MAPRTPLCPAPPDLRVRRWLALSILIAIAGCNGQIYVGADLDEKARRESAACPRLPARETMVPPPGVYANPRITIDNGKLVPRPDPRNNIDMGYADYVKANAHMVEQVYYDATHGNERAAWLICYLEVAARNLGRDLARMLSKLSCQLLLPCESALRDAMPPISDQTASDRRLLGLIGDEFEQEATRIRIRQTLIADALALISGVKVAGVIRPGVAFPGSSASSRAPRGASGRCRPFGEPWDRPALGWSGIISSSRPRETSPGSVQEAFTTRAMSSASMRRSIVRSAGVTHGSPWDEAKPFGSS